MNLNEIRINIDRIDFDLMRLLNERMEWAIRTRRHKLDVEDPNREASILKKAVRGESALVRSEYLIEMFRGIIAESRRRQAESPSLIGFQGEHGAYSEAAARIFFPGRATIPCSEFADVFLAVEEGDLDFGLVPVENSLGGVVTPVNDLLRTTSLRVTGETYLQVRHCLLAPPGTDHREIKVVYSHPQALSQCKAFLSRNKLEGRPFYDTAGAAKMIARDKPGGAAAIAGELCAGLYDLDVLKAGIEDHPRNVTRFLVLGRKPADEGDKCSLVFSAPHRAGSLLQILEIFAAAEINLTRIESIPVIETDLRYSFFVDIQGSDRDPRVSAALEKVKERASRYAFLGCYKEAKLP
jgi:prephenate dehydratase/chorismate mutase/prephenate dehydratase